MLRLPRPAPTAIRLATGSANAGGCNFPADPSHGRSSVFWSPLEDTSTVLLAPTPDGLIHFSDFRAQLTGQVMRTDELGTHVLFELGTQRRTQLLCHGHSERAGALAALVPLGLEGFDRLEALYRFLAALHRRRVPPDSRLTPQQRARARRMLQAWDGSRHGAAQQDIARVVLRQEPLARDDWQAASTRFVVMALLREARAMIAGGYRKLLRHRRRS